MSKTKVTSGSKRRWTREFKLAAVMRMNAAASIKALAEELGPLAEPLDDLHRRRSIRWCGRIAGDRPARSQRTSARKAPSLPSSSPLAGADSGGSKNGTEIGQQQLDLDFFRTALRHVGEQRRKQGGPGGTGSSR